MQLEFSCPDCQQQYSVDQSCAGHKVECTTCGGKFYLPELDELLDNDSDSAATASAASSSSAPAPASSSSAPAPASSGSRKLAAAARTTRACPRCLRSIPARAMVCMHCLAEDAKAHERLSDAQLMELMPADIAPNIEFRQAVAAALSLIPGDVARQTLAEIHFSLNSDNATANYFSSAALQGRSLLIIMPPLLLDMENAALHILHQVAHHFCSNNDHDHTLSAPAKPEQTALAWQTVKKWVPETVGSSIDNLLCPKQATVATPITAKHGIAQSIPVSKPTASGSSGKSTPPEAASASQIGHPHRKKLTLHR